jgi:hypothetical protein
MTAEKHRNTFKFFLTVHKHEYIQQITLVINMLKNTFKNVNSKLYSSAKKLSYYPNNIFMLLTVKNTKIIRCLIKKEITEAPFLNNNYSNNNGLIYLV